MDKITKIPSIQEALGQSDTFLAFQEHLSRAALVDRPVLIVGERGTGKELAAQRLHYLSHRWQSALVTLNCAVLPAHLIEAELFGHQRGAFTGASSTRMGRFEAADGGTLFLDEVGTLPLPVQEKLLRVVEYGSFERVGSSRSISVDVRIVAATNADLPALCRKGRFKPDLLDRLSFDVLRLPPLRSREGDILLLANTFAARMAQELRRDGVPRFSPEVIHELEVHTWPGNVRELKNVVERAVYQADGDAIGTIEIDPFGTWEAPPTIPPPVNRESTAAVPEAAGRPIADSPPAAIDALLDQGLPEAVWQLKVALLERALAAARFHQREAARHLGLTYHQFRGLYRKYRAWRARGQAGADEASGDADKSS
ncbi:MAG: phage shock protein operon transcriptional activator [Desulfosarcinaceae bacterium]|nr:phage shock protein operon transcriptional activator [Desulfosarcinaceae bacterium]